MKTDQASKRVLCGYMCPVGQACWFKAPQPPPPGSCVVGSLASYHPRGTAPRAGKACLGTLCFKHLEARLLGLGQYPWKRVSRPEATRKAATGPSARPGLEARKQVARPRQASDSGSAGLAAARAFGTEGRACRGPAPWAGRGARARRGLCPRAWAWQAHGGRGPLTSSVTRGCSFPRTWLQGTRCRCCSWPNSSRGRLWGSASPALAWNCSPTLVIFPPATPAGLPSTLRPARARLGAAPARPASAPRLSRRLRAAPPCRAHPGREGAPAPAGRGLHCAFRVSVGGEWRLSPWNRSSSGGCYPGPSSSRFLDSMKPHLPGTAVATGPDNQALSSPPLFNVGRLLSLTLARKVTIQQWEQAASALCHLCWRGKDSSVGRL